MTRFESGQPIRVCALQSGTSADGIDVLVVEAQGVGDTLVLDPQESFTVEWEPELRRRILDAAHGVAFTAHEWCELDTRLGEAFAHAVRNLAPVDLVVSHGQTLYHWIDDGQARGTVQLGEPSLIAEATAAPVISHVRHADIAAGGEGAPLMAFFDRLWLGAEAARRAAPIATVNIGGIANIQVVHPDGRVDACDTGPGNALIDAFIDRRTRGAQRFDRDGAFAASGVVHAPLLRAFRNHPYFSRTPPKTTGRHEFSLAFVDEAQRAIHESVSDADIAASLVELTATTIADAITAADVTEVRVSGGGVDNPLLMRRLTQHVGAVSVRSTAHWGVDPRSRENLMFVALGVHSWWGIPVAVAGPARRIAGRFSFPPQPCTRPSPRRPFDRLEIRT